MQNKVKLKMCLSLNGNFKKETEEFRNSSEILIGYKVLEKYKFNDEFFSPYQGFLYKLNKTYKSNRSSIDLARKEIEHFAIDYGFHFYSNLENAKKHFFVSKSIIAKFEILPENLVATGTFDSFESFVATEAKFVEIVEEFKNEKN